ETWNGTKWTLQPVPRPPGMDTSPLAAVSCSGISACVAVGSEARLADGTHQALAERWDGTTWRLEDIAPLPGVSSSEFSGVSCLAPSTCTVVGSYTITDRDGTNKPYSLLETRQ